jgi:hypothetical protein
MRETEVRRSRVRLGLDHMKLDSVYESLIRNRSCVRSAAAQGLAPGFASCRDVCCCDGSKRHQFDLIYLDLSWTDGVVTAELHLGSTPQSK